MFTRAEFLRRLPALLAAATPADAQKLERCCHSRIAGEETIDVVCSRRASFADATAFWVAAVVAQDWSRRAEYLRPYLEAGICRPLTEAGLNQFVANRFGGGFNDLLQSLRNAGDFVDAMLMDDDWNLKSVVAVYDEQYVAISWETTA